MASAPVCEARSLGTGKCVTTLLTEGGYVYPIIAHGAKTDRQQQQRLQSAPVGAEKVKRGDRPMHKTTLMIAKPPWEAKTDYTTTSQQYFGGSKTENPVRRPPRYPSMHWTSFKLEHSPSGLDNQGRWKTDYTRTFIAKQIVPANRLHLTSLVNRIDNTEGFNVREVMHSNREPTNYWSQYNRVHNKLGLLLGPGVPRPYRIRQQYNVLTGEHMGPAWQSENYTRSGNRVLLEARRQDTNPIAS